MTALVFFCFFSCCWIFIWVVYVLHVLLEWLPRFDLISLISLIALSFLQWVLLFRAGGVAGLTIWVSLVIRLCYLYVVYLLPNMCWFSSDGPRLLGWFLVERALPLLAFHCFKSTANYSSISRFQFVFVFLEFTINYMVKKMCKKCLNTAFCVVFLFKKKSFKEQFIQKSNVGIFPLVCSAVYSSGASRPVFIEMLVFSWLWWNQMVQRLTRLL